MVQSFKIIEHILGLYKCCDNDDKIIALSAKGLFGTMNRQIKAYYEESLSQYQFVFYQ